MNEHSLFELPITRWDERRDLIIPGDQIATIAFCAHHWITLCAHAIKEHGAFFVALSGGATPRLIFEKISSSAYEKQVDWSKVHLFWSDERAVGPDHPDSNFHMAMQAGLKKVGIPNEQIHRMRAENNIEENALEYEERIHSVLKGRSFDLIMLGMGEDGHTASLFPGTEALKAKHKLVVANYLPDKNSWRMTLTFDCINAALHIAIYVLGSAKKHTLAQALQSTGSFPIQQIGTKERRALWIVDHAAASLIAPRST